MRRTRTPQWAACLAVGLLASAQAEELGEESGHCRTVCDFHAGVVAGKCNAGRNPEENVGQDALDRWRKSLAESCMDACTTAPGYRDGFRIANEVSNAVPFQCWVKWRSCTPDDETGDCTTPPVPRIDVEAWLDSLMCNGRQGTCWKRVGAGRLAGCAFRATDNIYFLDGFDDDAVWRGFECVDGMVSGTGRLEFAAGVAFPVQHKDSGQMVKGYRTGFWTESSRVDFRADGWGSDDGWNEWTGSYYGDMKTGTWTRTTADGQPDLRTMYSSENEWLTEEWDQTTRQWRPFRRSREVEGGWTTEHWNSTTRKWE